jgi:predicted AAA+ superfamily ATPase
MAGFHRDALEVILSRIREDPRWLIVVSGPRQSGKTTLVREALHQVHTPSIYFAVDGTEDPEIRHLPRYPQETFYSELPRDRTWLIRTWERARRVADQSPHGLVLALDEIQQIPNWSATVKGLWDADRHAGRPLRVIILGSAPLLMQGGLTESLTGRFETIPIKHWSFAEMSGAFDFSIERYIYFGGYPGPALLLPDHSRWSHYVETSILEPTIERDVLAMQRIYKPALLRRLLRLGAGFSGQILSYNKMLGQLHDAGNATTLARYLQLLAGAGLLCGLENFAKSRQRRMASSPKLNVLNTAVIAAYSGYDFNAALADRTHWGRLVESAVGAHLVNTATREIGVYYWRDTPHEVDFVLKRGKELVAIEVKSGSRPDQVRGLREFERRHSPLDSIVVGENGIPVSEMLSVPAGHWFEDQ